MALGAARGRRPAALSVEAAVVAAAVVVEGDEGIVEKEGRRGGGEVR